MEGTGHNFVVAGLAELASVINNNKRHLRTQSTLICSEISAPIPDGLVLKGLLSDYRGKRPSAADAYCVIEVSDSSYERDSGEKLKSYAHAGIEQYIIINLRNRTAEIYYRCGYKQRNLSTSSSIKRTSFAADSGGGIRIFVSATRAIAAVNCAPALLKFSQSIALTTPAHWLSRTRLDHC